MIDKKSNVLILSHFFVRTISSGPPQDVRDFLLPKVRSIVYIEHPFPFNVKQNENTQSSLTIYEEGKLTKRINFLKWKGFDVSFYIKDVLVTQWFLLKSRRKFDLCIALDNLNTLSVLLWRKLRLIKKLVYYTIDYNPIRFTNRLLNKIYHSIDKLCCYNVDCIWNLSPRMMEGRKNNGVIINRCAPSVIVSMGAHLSRIQKLPVEEIERYTLVYVGALSKRQGVQLVLKVLPDIIKEIPQIKFIVIGKGEYEQQLKDLTERLGVEKYVVFKGFVKDDNDVEEMLCRSAVGMACYVPEETNYVFYTDPGKPKLYLGCGLPMIITRVPAIADDIEKHGAGIAIEYDENSFKQALIRLLTDDNFYTTCRERAIAFSEMFDTEHILADVLWKTLV